MKTAVAFLLGYVIAVEPRLGLFAIGGVLFVSGIYDLCLSRYSRSRRDVPSGLSGPKPPLGLRPRFIADEERLSEVAGAIDRYGKAGRPVPIEWLAEYDEMALSCQANKTESND